MEEADEVGKRRVRPLYIVLLALALVLVYIPGPASAGPEWDPDLEGKSPYDTGHITPVPEKAGPCISTGSPPKILRIDPNCELLPFESPAGSSQVATEATATGPDVDIAWSLNITNQTRENITSFNVLRGPSPDALELVADTPASERTLTDRFAVVSGEALWYQVEAVLHGGAETVPSRPVMVSFAVEG